MRRPRPGPSGCAAPMPAPPAPPPPAPKQLARPRLRQPAAPGHAGRDRPRRLRPTAPAAPAGAAASGRPRPGLARPARGPATTRSAPAASGDGTVRRSAPRQQPVHCRRHAGMGRPAVRCAPASRRRRVPVAPRPGGDAAASRRPAAQPRHDAARPARWPRRSGGRAVPAAAAGGPRPAVPAAPAVVPVAPAVVVPVAPVPAAVAVGRCAGGGGGGGFAGRPGGGGGAGGGGGVRRPSRWRWRRWPRWRHGGCLRPPRRRTSDPRPQVQEAAASRVRQHAGARRSAACSAPRGNGADRPAAARRLADRLRRARSAPTRPRWSSAVPPRRDGHRDPVGQRRDAAAARRRAGLRDPGRQPGGRGPRAARVLRHRVRRGRGRRGATWSRVRRSSPSWVTSTTERPSCSTPSATPTSSRGEAGGITQHIGAYQVAPSSRATSARSPSSTPRVTRRSPPCVPVVRRSPTSRSWWSRPTTA